MLSPSCVSTSTTTGAGYAAYSFQGTEIQKRSYPNSFGGQFQNKGYELIDELKAEYTIAIVTHNMQQAARVSQHTAFMYLGELIEFGATDNIFIKPARKETEDYITGRFG